MISLRIKDTKNFMSELLLKTAFDFFDVSEASITTFCTFNINGHLCRDFYDEDELTELGDVDFTSWKNVRPVCFNLIKGKKTPSRLKITFRLPSSNYDNVVNKSGCGMSPTDISGLYLHIVYENGVINAVTATSLNLFTMDKSLDRYWDDTIKTFFLKHFDVDENNAGLRG